jgi:hypothetical protein
LDIVSVSFLQVRLSSLTFVEKVRLESLTYASGGYCTSKGLRRQPDPPAKIVQTARAQSIRFLGPLHCHGVERNLVTRAELAQKVEVSTDDLGDLGIAANRLPVYAQDNGLTVAGNLDCSGSYRFGN